MSSPDAVHGFTLRAAYPLPGVEAAERIVAEHQPSPGYPRQCRCGAVPWSQCRQRLEAQAVLDAAKADGS